MRGLAALAVVVRHTPAFFGGAIGPESFLAVDLFFAISGFVLAHAYHDRLDLGGFGVRFMLARVIRLYPLYAVGLALGLSAALMAGRAPMGDLALTAGVMAFMILAPSTGLSGAPTPAINDPCWSLFFELVANVVMAAFWRFLSNRVLVAVCGISAAGLIATAAQGHTLDTGGSWETAGIGLARVGFSFFAGLLIYRKRDGFKHGVSPWLVLAVMAGALLYAPPPALRAIYELAWVLVGFPVLVGLAVQSEPGFGARTFKMLGVASYAVYVLHFPLRRFYRSGVIDLTHRDVPSMTPWMGIAFLAIVLVVALLLDRFYDRPVRKRLTELLTAPRRPHRQAGATGEFADTAS